MPLINPPHTIFASEAAAQAVADRCAADDRDGYCYVVNVSPANGRAVIEVFDETGYKLGLL